MGMNQDGYTKEIKGPEGVRVLVAIKAKRNQDPKSPLDREFFKSFLHVSFLKLCLALLFKKFVLILSWG